MAGILFYQDRSQPEIITPDPMNEIRRVEPGSTFAGAFYFPTQGFNLEGFTATAPWTVVFIVARTEIEGVTLQINNDFAGSPSALPPIKIVTLVE